MSAFLLSIKGQVESVSFPECNELFLKYQFVYGDDWMVTVGFDEGLTQVSQRYDYDHDFVFAFPIDVTFKSTNPKGWPQIIFCAYGRDIWGHEVLRGYGVTTIPVSVGSNLEKVVGLFTPENSNLISKLSSWISGRHAELQDPRILSRNRGREVLQTRSKGCIRLKLNLLSKDFSVMGYQTISAASKPDQLNLPSTINMNKPPRNHQQRTTLATQYPVVNSTEQVDQVADVGLRERVRDQRSRQRTNLDEEIEPVPSTSQHDLN